MHECAAEPRAEQVGWPGATAAATRTALGRCMRIHRVRHSWCDHTVPEFTAAKTAVATSGLQLLQALSPLWNTGCGSSMAPLSIFCCVLPADAHRFMHECLCFAVC